VDNCGAPLVRKGKIVEDHFTANPNDQRPNRTIATELGVSEWTVRDAKQKSGARSLAPEDDRPTIDKPPRGELWDDQNDTII
jgi:hypothetical protein